MTAQRSPQMQGPEGRPPNVSPARKGWEIDPEEDQSAVGAALKPIVRSPCVMRSEAEESAVSLNLKRIAGRAGLGATGKLRTVDAGAGLAGGADYVHQL